MPKLALVVLMFASTLTVDRTWVHSGSKSRGLAVHSTSGLNSTATCGSRGIWWGLGSPMTEAQIPLEDALIEWLEEMSVSTRERTHDELARAARRWGDYGLGSTVVGVSPDTIRRYLIAYRAKHAASTTNQERTLLAWFFHWAARRGLIERDPVRDSPRFPEERRSARTVDDGEFSRLVSAADATISAILVLAVETGLRRSTLLDLQWEWIDLDGGWISIPPKAMKTREAYRAPLSDLAIGSLKRIRDRVSGPVFEFTRSTLHKRFDEARKRAGVSCVFHDLRRTFFTRLRRQGVPLEVAMALSAHRDVKTALRHYRAIDPDELLRAVGRSPDAERRRSES